jgi:hypothetical protein
MFGRGKNEIVEIKTGTLNAFYIDRISENRIKTNKINASEDIIIALLSDASESEFQNLFDEFLAQNEEFDRFKFQQYLSQNGFYSFTFNQWQHMVPGQEW